MPKFVWQQTSRGGWSPSIYHGEMPRDMQAACNAHLYRAHVVPPGDFDAAEASGRSTLSFLAELFPPPPPEIDEPKFQI